MEAERPKLTVLSDKTIERIIDESLTLLAETGVIIEEAETRELLAQAGAEVSGPGDRIRLKRDAVEGAIASAPKSLTLFDLAGRECFRFGDSQIHFNPGSAALFVLDPGGKGGPVARKPLTEDVVRFVKLVDTLENIEVASTGVVPSDVPEIASDAVRLYLACRYSTKPVVTGTFTERGFRPMLDLLMARTGAESLRDKPCAIFDVCPSSPLRWSALGCHDLRMCAQNAVPAELISMPLAGALAPMSLLASVVQHTAETLSGVLIHQTWTPGSPVIYGGSPALFDMRHSTSPMGAPETLLVDLAYAEVGKYLGFPTQAYLGMSDAKVVDAQAGLETAMTIALAATGKIDFVSGPGMLNFENCQSLEKLIADNEICGMARRLKRGLEPRGKTLGLDAIRDGLKEGSFFTLDETLRLYKEEAFYPGKVIDRKAFKDEGPVDAARFGDIATAEVARRLAAYKEPAIPDANLKDLEALGKKLEIGGHNTNFRGRSKS